MAYVLFTADFDYRPTPSIVIAYRAGMELAVKRECADQAVAAYKAISRDHIKRKRADVQDKIRR